MKHFITIVMLFGLFTSASAATLEQTKTFNNFTSSTNQLVFEKFNRPGILRSVRISVNAESRDGYLLLDNDGDQPVDTGAELGVICSVLSEDLPLTGRAAEPVVAPIRLVSPLAFRLDADLGDGPNMLNQAGGDAQMRSGTPVKSGTTEIIDASDHALFTGSGSYTLKVHAAGIVDFDRKLPLQCSYGTPRIDCTITVIYEY